MSIRGFAAQTPAGEALPDAIEALRPKKAPVEPTMLPRNNPRANQTGFDGQPISVGVNLRPIQTGIGTTVNVYA